MSADATVHGIGVSPGRAVGPVVHLVRAVPTPPPGRRLPEDTDLESAARSVADAAAEVADDLQRRAEAADGDARAVLEAAALMATDATLVDAAQQKVRDLRLPPARAVWEAGEEVAEQLAGLGGYMAERAGDVRDVRDRIVALLLGVPLPGIPAREEPFVLVGVDLAPADTAQLDAATVRAIVTAEGGPTSHTAILARALGIPAVVSVPDALAVLPEGRTVVVDGARGVVELDPGAEEVAAVEKRMGQVRAFDGTGRTADGHRVELLANVGDPHLAADAAAAGAEGVGLFRTEFCFLDRGAEPGVEEQVAAYRQFLAAFPDRKVVIRTLDAGADKPLPYLTAASEPNPALGVRGLRTARTYPDVLDRQLTAIAQAAAAERAEVWVMAPMVATVGEAEEFVRTCHAHGLPTAGVMVEIPSAALLAGPILARAAFASIGTNDLVQYTMAADRLLGPLADLSSALHPAVLRLVAETCRGGEQQDRPVGVCGEAAADPVAAVVLVGLGVTSLSMSPRALGDVAAVLAATPLERCQELARAALEAESAEEALALVRDGLPVLTELGL